MKIGALISGSRRGDSVRCQFRFQKISKCLEMGPFVYFNLRILPQVQIISLYLFLPRETCLRSRLTGGENIIDCIAASWLHVNAHVAYYSSMFIGIYIHVTIASTLKFMKLLPGNYPIKIVAISLCKIVISLFEWILW